MRSEKVNGNEPQLLYGRFNISIHVEVTRVSTNTQLDNEHVVWQRKMLKLSMLLVIEIGNNKIVVVIHQQKRISVRISLVNNGWVVSSRSSG